MQVATFKVDGDKFTALKTVPVTYSGATTRVPALVGSACPDMAYPNYQDWGFVKVQLDKRSFATARASLSNVEDPLLRTMLWQSLWDGVRDGKLPLNEFIKTALANAPLEKDYTLLGDVLGKVAASKEYLDLMGVRSAWATQTRSALEDMAWKAALANKGNDNFQRRWFDAYLGLSSTAPALGAPGRHPGGHESPSTAWRINQDLRWAIVRPPEPLQPSGLRKPGGSRGAKRDNSDAGQASALAATVIRPDPAAQGRVAGEDRGPANEAAVLQGPHCDGQPLSGRAERAGRTDGGATPREAAGASTRRPVPSTCGSYAHTLIPTNCTPASVKRLTEAAAQMKDLSASTRRSLLDAQRGRPALRDHQAGDDGADEVSDDARRRAGPCCLHGLPAPPWTPLVLTLGLHLLLVLAWLTARAAAACRIRRSALLPSYWSGRRRGPSRRPIFRHPRPFPVAAGRQPSISQGLSWRGQPPLRRPGGRPASHKPALHASATEALPGDLLKSSRAMAGRIDRELRNGASPISAEPERKWERFAQAFAEARTSRSYSMTLEDYTDGGRHCRLPQDHRRTNELLPQRQRRRPGHGLRQCRGGRGAGYTPCPTGVSWTRH